FGRAAGDHAHAAAGPRYRGAWRDRPPRVQEHLFLRSQWHTARALGRHCQRGADGARKPRSAGTAGRMDSAQSTMASGPQERSGRERTQAAAERSPGSRPAGRVIATELRSRMSATPDRPASPAERRYRSTAFTNDYEFAKGGYALPQYPFVAPPELGSD